MKVKGEWILNENQWFNEDGKLDENQSSFLSLNNDDSLLDITVSSFYNSTSKDSIRLIIGSFDEEFNVENGNFDTLLFDSKNIKINMNKYSKNGMIQGILSTYFSVNKHKLDTVVTARKNFYFTHNW